MRAPRATKRTPRVLTRCVANYYRADDERIIEFSFPDGGGGLISFRTRGGRPMVNVYGLDPNVAVVARGVAIEHGQGQDPRKATVTTTDKAGRTRWLQRG